MSKKEEKKQNPEIKNRDIDSVAGKKLYFYPKQNALGEDEKQAENNRKKTLKSFAKNAK